MKKFVEIIKMTPQEMADRGAFLSVMATVGAATYLAMLGGDILNLDKVSQRKDEFEPYIEYDDGDVVIGKSWFTESDLENYLSPKTLNQLPVPAVGDGAGVSWLLDNKSTEPDCKVMVLNFPSVDDKYYAVSNSGVVTDLSANPEVVAQLSSGGGKIIDILIQPDKSLRVLYEGNDRQDDFMVENKSGLYVVAR